LILASVLATGAGAQEKAGPAGPVPRNLDEMIATALKASPEVLLAEAKVRQAQAELNQTRLKVTRDVVAAFNERKQKQLAVESAKTQLNHFLERHNNGAGTKTEVDQAKLDVGAAELGLAQSDADIRYLLGVGSQIETIATQQPVASKPRPKRPSVPPETMNEPLMRPVKGPFEQTNLGDLAAHLAEQAKVSILVDFDELGVANAKEFDVSIPLREPVTLIGALQALADQYKIAFVIRDYGIMATSESRAEQLDAYAIPVDLPLESKDR
jgi:hypothetical protein